MEVGRVRMSFRRDMTRREMSDLSTLGSLFKNCLKQEGEEEKLI